MSLVRLCDFCEQNVSGQEYFQLKSKQINYRDEVIKSTKIDVHVSCMRELVGLIQEGKKAKK